MVDWFMTNYHIHVNSTNGHKSHEEKSMYVIVAKMPGWPALHKLQLEAARKVDDEYSLLAKRFCSPSLARLGPDSDWAAELA